MRNCLLVCYIALIAGCTDRHAIVIEGTLPDDSYDNETVYWVPMEGASSATVDSTLISGNTFRIVVSAYNRNKVGIIRVKPYLRLALQDIVVVAEEGTTQVQLSTFSRAGGTPLNDTLQQWKERKSAYDYAINTLRRQLNDAADHESDAIRDAMDTTSAAYYEDMYQIVVHNQDNEVGRLIFSFYKAVFTEGQVRGLGPRTYHNEIIK